MYLSQYIPISHPMRNDSYVMVVKVMHMLVESHKCEVQVYMRKYLVDCLLSYVCCLRFTVCCLVFSVQCLVYTLYCHLSDMSCLLSDISCLLVAVKSFQFLRLTRSFPLLMGHSGGRRRICLRQLSNVASIPSVLGNTRLSLQHLQRGNKIAQCFFFFFLF